jgi:uncharacterized protein
VTVLLDANVLIALLNSDHVHHGAARDWLVGLDGRFATCPITEGALTRFVIRGGGTADEANQIMGMLADHPRREFWADSVSYAQVSLKGVIGHRQVTDAYLAGLARSNRGQLATFDQGLAQLHHDVAVVVPTANRPNI